MIMRKSQPSNNQSEPVIEVRNSGTRARRETYPFGLIKQATRLDRHPRGQVEGESFFIPDSAKPWSHISNAKLRHKAKFAGRAVVEMIKGKPVKGVRVWRLEPFK
jgi:hypothetical protein